MGYHMSQIASERLERLLNGLGLSSKKQTTHPSSDNKESLDFYQMPGTTLTPNTKRFSNTLWGPARKYSIRKNCFYEYIFFSYLYCILHMGYNVSTFPIGLGAGIRLRPRSNCIKHRVWRLFRWLIPRVTSWILARFPDVLVIGFYYRGSGPATPRCTPSSCKDKSRTMLLEDLNSKAHQKKCSAETGLDIVPSQD